MENGKAGRPGPQQLSTDLLTVTGLLVHSRSFGAISQKVLSARRIVSTESGGVGLVTWLLEYVPIVKREPDVKLQSLWIWRETKINLVPRCPWSYYGVDNWLRRMQWHVRRNIEAGTASIEINSWGFSSIAEVYSNFALLSRGVGSSESGGSNGYPSSLIQMELLNRSVEANLPLQPTEFRLVSCFLRGIGGVPVGEIHPGSKDRVGNENNQPQSRHSDFQIIEPMFLFAIGLATVVVGWWLYWFSRPYYWRDFWLGLCGMVLGFIVTVWSGALVIIRVF